MTLGDYRAVRTLPPGKIVYFSMPNGTVTVNIDRSRGLLEIFTEHEVDPVDWDLTCQIINRMGLSGEMGQPEYLRGVDVFTINLRPPLRLNPVLRTAS